MSKIESLKEHLNKIQQEILDLVKFRDTPQLRKFRRQLEGEKSEIKARITKLTQTQEGKTSEHLKIIKKANHNRSAKMIRNWNYLRAVQENYFPKMSLREIRTQHKIHSQGLESAISDVAWRNPSP